MEVVYKTGFTLLIFLLCLAGCSDVKQKQNPEVNTSEKVDVSTKIDSIGFDQDTTGTEYFILKFPKKVVLNKAQRGDLWFHSHYNDSIKLSKEDRRWVYFYANTFDRRMTLEELKKTSLDTFVMLEDKWIPFKLKFDQVGKHRIDGYIEEIILLKNYYPNGDARMITNDIRVIREVEVTDDQDYEPVPEILRG